MKNSYESDSASAFLEGLERFISRYKRAEKKKIRVPRIDSSSGDEERREALRRLLNELSSEDPLDALSEDEIREVCSFFSTLYGGEPKFRHRYADVCDIVFGFLESSIKCDEDLDDGVPYQVNSLTENMSIIYSNMLMQRPDEVEQIGSVWKLCDHIELERTRLRHFVGQSNLIKEYDEKRAQLEEKAKKDRKELEERAMLDRAELERDFESRVGQMRNEYIGILGVFSAIVLAFNGAVGFSTSSIVALGTNDGVRSLVFMVALVGFVLIAAIVTLLMFLWKMVFKSAVDLSGWPKWAVTFAMIALAVIMIACAVHELLVDDGLLPLLTSLLSSCNVSQ